MDEPEQQSRARYYFFISLLNHLYWVTGTLMGALIGQVIKTDLRGMDFALTALFVVLVIEQYKKGSFIATFSHWSRLQGSCALFSWPPNTCFLFQFFQARSHFCY